MTDPKRPAKPSIDPFAVPEPAAPAQEPAAIAPDADAGNAPRASRPTRRTPAPDATGTAADAADAFEDGHDAVHVITDRDEYLEAVRAIAAGTGPVAVDAERASGYRYSQRAYLIQVFRRDAGVFLFDPIPLADFAELQSAIGDEEWVFHAASQDLACLREVGLDPSRIFDTELGARIAGFPRVGLGAVVEELLGIHLAKAHSAADWSTRPLPQSWLVYAALDVELLPDLRDALAGRLADAAKTEIAAQEFDAVLHRAPKPPRAEPWRRLSGMHALRGQRSLAIARALWTARDDFARQKDVAPGRTIPDSAIVSAAAANPSSKKELGAIKTFTGRSSRQELDRWWAAVEDGRTTEDLPRLRGSGEPTLPPPRSWSDRNPDADRRYRAARAAIVELAEQMDIPVENLLTPDTLRTIAWEPPTTIDVASIGAALTALDARPWQVEATAERITSGFVAAAQADAGPADAAS